MSLIRIPDVLMVAGIVYGRFYQKIPEYYPTGGRIRFCKDKLPGALKKEIEKNRPGDIFMSSVCAVICPKKES